MSISKIFNTSGIARQCQIPKHKMMLFNNGVIKSLTPDQLTEVKKLIQKETDKSIKHLNKLILENEKNNQ